MATCEVLLVGSPELRGPCLRASPLLSPTLPSSPSRYQPVCAEFPVAQRAVYPVGNNKSKHLLYPFIYVNLRVLDIAL